MANFLTFYSSETICNLQTIHKIQGVITRLFTLQNIIEYDDGQQ